MLYYLCRFILWPIFFLIFRPVAYGRENLRVRGKAIFVCNHLSMLDPIQIMIVSPRVVHFMAKAELFRTPIARLFFRALLAFPVERSRADMGSVKNALRVLEQGKVFGIFPEGKRSITGELDDLEKGAAFLASRSAAPIIPIYIHKDSYTRLRIVMAVGNPIRVDELLKAMPKSKAIDTITAEIDGAFRALKAQLEG